VQASNAAAFSLLFLAADGRIQEFSQGFDGSVPRGLVELEVMAEKLHRRSEVRHVEIMIGAGVDGDLDRNPFALLA
jgi:hypothetical protein